MSESKPGLLGRLFGRRGEAPGGPDPAASRSEGVPDFANAAGAGELAPVEPTVTGASPDADGKLPSELAGPTCSRSRRSTRRAERRGSRSRAPLRSWGSA
jgi:hypothetical protein